jgi:chitinase
VGEASRRAHLPQLAGDSAAGDSRLDGLTRDDPRTSPYPLWRDSKAYTEGAKVVWQGRVYQAKWWTESDQPDAPVKHLWETPWRYLGPVLESDRAAVRAGNPANDGSRTRWAAEMVFVAGDEVKHDGHAFRAKWWTQGDPPEEDPDQPYDHPWEYLGELPED